MESEELRIKSRKLRCIEINSKIGGRVWRLM